MAVLNVRRRSSLDSLLVLAPERYNARRSLQVAPDDVALSAIVAPVTRTVDAGSGMSDDTQCVVLDTSDVREGVIVGGDDPVPPSSLGSTKKLFGPGDVLISRLRPYLRQVAWVDGGFVRAHRGCALACSTEFLVLTSVDGGSIAFLVPWLLTPAVQSALEAAQEGGHHPRVKWEFLLGLRVPAHVVRQRDEASAAMVAIADRHREAALAMQALIGGLAAPPAVRGWGPPSPSDAE